MLAPYGGTQMGRFSGGSIYTPNNLKTAWGLGRSLGKGLKRKADDYFKKPLSKKARKSQQKTGFQENKSDQLSIAGGDSKSYYTKVNRTKSKIGKLEIVPSNVVQNSSGRLTAGVGVQAYATIGTYFDKTDIVSLFATGPGSTYSSTRIQLRSVHAVAMVTNQETANCYATIFDIIPKRDGSTGSVSPLAVLQAGMADNVGAIASTYTCPGATPYSNPRFTEFFKVVNRTEVVLSPGQTHSHVVHYAPNKMYSHELDSFITGGIRGVTMWSVILYHGSPCNDITTKTQVSLSACALDYVIKEEYKFAYVHNNTGIASVINDLPIAFTVAGNVMEDDGNAKPDINA